MEVEKAAGRITREVSAAPQPERAARVTAAVLRQSTGHARTNIPPAAFTDAVIPFRQRANRSTTPPSEGRSNGMPTRLR